MDRRTQSVNRAQQIFSSTEVAKSKETNNFKSLMRKLENALQKELKLWWDMTTLNAYIEKEMIPRGLRIKKAVTSSQPPEFTVKWNTILSECSQKLMHLIVESEKTQLKQMEKEIADINKDIVPFQHLSDYDTTNQKLLDNLSRLEESLAILKQTKFQRDLADYENEQVYNWRSNPRRRFAPRPILKDGQSTRRQVNFSDSERSNNRSDLSGETTDSSYDESSSHYNQGMRPNIPRRNPQDLPTPQYQRFNPQPSTMPKNGGRGGAENTGAKRYPQRNRPYRPNMYRY